MAMKFTRLAVAIGALLIVASTATTLFVIQSARRIAGTTPYCIQVADGRADYRPARTLFDLSGLMMRATREKGLYMQHHALLIVGDEANPGLFHWSYHARGFIPGVHKEAIADRRPAMTCVPRRDFIAG